MSGPRGRAAVLVVNWRGAKLTADCLASLDRAGVARRDVLVVDNGSGDGSAEAVAAAFPDVGMLRLPGNLGYAGGSNRGLERLLAEGYEHVLLLNNDTLVPPGLVERLLSEMDADGRLAFVQPRLVAFDGRTVDNAGGQMDRQGATWMRGRGEDPSASHPRGGFFYVSCACGLVRAAALREVGLFDERHFMYNEDVDLSWRLRLAGWRLAVADDARCLHAESSTAGTSPRKMGVIWRNRFLTLLKNYGAARLAYRLPRALVASFLWACASAVTQREWRLPWLHLKAVAWNARHLRATLRERRRVQALRRVRDRDLEPLFVRSVEWRMVREGLRRRMG